MFDFDQQSAWIRTAADHHLRQKPKNSNAVGRRMTAVQRTSVQQNCESPDLDLAMRTTSHDASVGANHQMKY